MPKLRSVPFETAIIERYRRRESSVEEALIEMYLAGVSVRRVEDITEALWRTHVSPGTVSKLNQKVYKKIDAWRNRPLTSSHPYIFMEGIATSILSIRSGSFLAPRFATRPSHTATLPPTGRSWPARATERKKTCWSCGPTAPKRGV